ncbi:MAG: HAD family hydrolase [Caldilineaceae bacterium]|nr:HAD family hydrolase [Caldilineaceae bacterium]MCB0145348.1 HAD family hydrolase [Caldilineaceae bacterium]MCB9149831.1 HAD family hydrolase [Caldilineaceae bacterium]
MIDYRTFLQIYFHIPKECILTVQLPNNVSPTKLESLRSVRAVLLDMDGVVYVGESPLPGVQPFLDYLEATGRHWLCVTNNSSKTPAMFVEKLQRMNVRAHTENVLGSAQATATWMAEQFPQRGKAVMIGEEGLRSALLENGFELTESEHDADFAVVGINFDLRYEHLARAALAIRNGARFIGTNHDPSFPSERGQVPGTGSILALIATATGVQPTIIGKPNAGMYDQALHRLGVTAPQTLMVGDRYDTDIAGAIELGMTTVGVLTGVTKRESFERENPPPHFILDNIPTLLALMQQADNQ